MKRIILIVLMICSSAMAVDDIKHKNNNWLYKYFFAVHKYGMGNYQIRNRSIGFWVKEGTINENGVIRNKLGIKQGTIKPFEDGSGYYFKPRVIQIGKKSSIDNEGQVTTGGLLNTYGRSINKKGVVKSNLGIKLGIINDYDDGSGFYFNGVVTFGKDWDVLIIEED